MRAAGNGEARVRAATRAEIPDLALILGESFPGLSRRVLAGEPGALQSFWERVLEQTWGRGSWLVLEPEKGGLLGMGWLTGKGRANPVASTEVCRELGGKLRGRWVYWTLEQLGAPELGAGEAYLDWMAVHPTHRRCGFGRRLLDGIVDHAKLEAYQVLKLDVETGNRDAIKLYRDRGFREGSAHWKPMLTLLYGCGQLACMELELS